MEDSVGEEERREQGEIIKKARQDDAQVDAGRGGGGSGEPGEVGFLSAMASKIGAAVAGRDENSGDDGGRVNATAASNGVEEKRGDDGHGGGGIFQKLMSSSHAPSAESEASETEEVKGEEKMQDAGAEQGGILSSMASRIGMAMSGANGNGRHHSAVDDDAKTTSGDAADHRKDEKNGDEANSGGILSSMASKISMAMSSSSGHGDHSTVGDAVDHANGDLKQKEGEASGGILSAMASKIGMTISGGNVEGNHDGSGDDAKTSNGHADGDKVEEKASEANGGGLVDQIMSNLPSEDQAPEADEASLLIAIIED